jgi:hypothetical protein
MPDRYQRVSWVPDTGEIYVTDALQTYRRVLGVIPTWAEIESALDGWAAVGASPRAPLAWIEMRLARWAAGQPRS